MCIRCFSASLLCPKMSFQRCKVCPTHARSHYARCLFHTGLLALAASFLGMTSISAFFFILPICCLLPFRAPPWQYPLLAFMFKLICLLACPSYQYLPRLSLNVVHSDLPHCPRAFIEDKSLKRHAPGPLVTDLCFHRLLSSCLHPALHSLLSCNCTWV